MSGLEKILDKILADAAVSGEQEIQEANRLAASFLADDEAQAAVQSEKRVAEARTQARLLVDRSRSAAKLKTRRFLLQERNRIIDEVLSDVKAGVISLPDAEYFQMLERFIRSHRQQGSGTLVLNKRDLARLPDGFASSLSGDLSMKLTISGTAGEFDAGCVLLFGEIEYNGTIDALISEKKDELRDLLNRELFAE